MSPSEHDGRERVTILRKSDLKFSYYCGPGHGGQAKNKVASGVMIRHEESGAIAKAHDSRSQDENKRAAFERLCKTPQMKFWLAKKVYEVHSQETIEKTVERECSPENCRFEVKDEAGKWMEVPASHFDTPMAKQVTCA